MSEKTMKEVQREIERMVRTSRHDYIVQIRGIVPRTVPYTDCCIVMEFMEHGSLKSFRKRLKSFPHAVKVRMVYEVSLGMNFLHTQSEPIIHRDMKLENIFVSRGLTAKVGDLGLATWYTASDFKERGGTITHIPPENLANTDQTYTTKYDIYSFGVTLWEFAAGRQPYENAHGNTNLISLWVSEDKKPGKIPDDEPDVIKRLIEDTWQQNPAKRPEFQVIKEIVRQEFEAKYKSNFDAGHADILMQLQLSALAAKQEECDGEMDRFPWESRAAADVPDSPHASSRKERCFAVPSGQNADPSGQNADPGRQNADPGRQNADPLPLQSVDHRVPMETEEPKDARYPVAESNAQQERNVFGMSELMERIADMRPGGAELPDPRDSGNPVAHKLQTDQRPSSAHTGGTVPTRQSGTVLCQPTDAGTHADEPHPPGQYHYTGGGTATNAAPNEKTAQQQSFSSLHPNPTFDPQSHQGFKPQQMSQSGGFGLEGFSSNPPYTMHPNPQQFSQPQFYGNPYSAQVHPVPISYLFQPQPPKDSNAHPISISVKGDGNVVTVAPGGSIVKVGKTKMSKKAKKSKRKPPTPSPSSSSSSDNSDEQYMEVDGKPVMPSITTSKEPVTEKDIREIDEHIGKNYKKLGRKLGLPEHAIENIEGDHHFEGLQEMAFQVMLAWIRRNRKSEVTKSKLARALVDIGLQNVAEKL